MTAPVPRPGFLERRPLRTALGKALRHWRERHQHPFNFAIHLLGIPLALAGVVLFFALPWAEWYWGAAAFGLGYLLQFLGHRVEGNDLGEWAGIKRLLGLPYVAIAPQWSQRPKPQDERSESWGSPPENKRHDPQDLY